MVKGVVGGSPSVVVEAAIEGIKGCVTEDDNQRLLQESGLKEYATMDDE